MRTLEFKVKSQKLSKLPGCDFSSIVAGSKGYLKAKFYFELNEEWNTCRKVAVFTGTDDVEVEYPVLLDEDNSCEIPSEVLTRSKFKVYVIGARTKPIFKIQTKPMTIKQEVM